MEDPRVLATCLLVATWRHRYIGRNTSPARLNGSVDTIVKVTTGGLRDDGDSFGSASSSESFKDAHAALVKFRQR